MVRELPRELEEALAEALSGVDMRLLREVGGRLSQAYRAVSPGPLRPVRDARTALAYAAWLMPATHAQLAAALDQAAEAMPELAPRSLLDLGAGPGTALWAAACRWPSLEKAVASEREPAFIELGKRLARSSSTPVVRGADWRQGDLLGDAAPAGRHDVVILGHVLGEIAAPRRSALVDAAWAACAGVLILVEPGTPRGFAAVREARERLLARGAFTVAPCTHDEPCPLVDDWCHFAERTERPELQRRIKGASLPWEDAKLAHASLSRTAPSARGWGRVVRSPSRAKHRIHVRACAAGGLVDETVPRSRREAYAVARRLSWGDVVPQREDLLAAKDESS